MDLRPLFGDGPCWLELGIVLSPPIPPPLAPTSARVVRIALATSDRVVEARVINLGQGLARGVFTPILPGDEVLVLFPGGDPNRAVMLGGLGNGVAVNPLANLGLAMVLLHPGGTELRSVDGLPANGIVMGTFLAGLLQYVTALQTAMAAIVAAVPEAPPDPSPGAIAIGAAAAAFLANPSVSAFVSALSTSAGAGIAPGVGGPPYASALNRVTT